MATRRSVIRGSRTARKSSGLDGLDELIRKLEKTVDAIGGQQAGPEIKQVAYEAGEMLRDQVVQNAPYDQTRKEGIHLRDAAFVSKGDETRADVLVGVNVRKAPHAHLVEFGTVSSAAQPYFRPALTQTGQRIADHIKTGVLRIIERNSK